ncbi:MAG: nucleotidyltransferase domain-containing protein [Myxococcales bacterium]|nr:nucleotidyltransferase domain-containing protein [Myxococcales bacterium]
MSTAVFEPLLSALVRNAEAELGDRLLAVAVYGSVARGQAGPASDVDLLVVADGLPNSPAERLRSFSSVEAATRPEVEQLRARGYRAELSPLLWSPAQLAAFSFLQLDLATDARILFDPRGLLSRRLEGVRRKMAELGTRRVPYRGTYYWLLKPDLKPGEVIEL